MPIRSMQPEDADAVAELAAQLGYMRSPGEIVAWLTTAGASDFQAAFVAVEDALVVGWIEVCIERRIQSAPCALIGGLVVREGVRGKRVGQRLCLAAEQWARERDVRLVRVTSRSTRQDAHRFYLRDGYEIVKTSVVFEKTLVP